MQVTRLMHAIVHYHCHVQLLYFYKPRISRQLSDFCAKGNALLHVDGIYQHYYMLTEYTNLYCSIKHASPKINKH